MSRWAQRRRRGGGPGAEITPPPPVAAFIISATFLGDGAATVRYLFSQPVTVVADSPVFEYDNADSGWTPSTTLTQIDAMTIDVVWSLPPSASGRPWRLVTTPEPDVTSPGGFDVPESGNFL